MSVPPSPPDFKLVVKKARDGHWRDVRSAVDDWVKTPSWASWLATKPSPLVELGLACLNKRSWPMIAHLLSLPQLPQVPSAWTMQALNQNQDDFAAWLLARMPEEVVKGDVHAPQYVITTWPAMACKRGAAESIKVLASRGVRDPLVLARFVAEGNHDASFATALPHLLAMGGSLHVWPSRYNEAFLVRFNSNIEAATPFQAALMKAHWRTAQALLEAGIDPKLPCGEGWRQKNAWEIFEKGLQVEMTVARAHAYSRKGKAGVSVQSPDHPDQRQEALASFIHAWRSHPMWRELSDPDFERLSSSGSQVSGRVAAALLAARLYRATADEVSTSSRRQRL
jgi:hypothetical protein